jgi:hypothetical protein
MHALFITTPAPAEPFDTAESDQDGERTMDLQPGQIVMLEPGEEVQTSAPADSGQTKGALPRSFRECLDRDSRSFRTTPVRPFQYRTLLQVSAALGIPYAYLSNDLARANYSDSRPALLEFRRRVEACRHAAPRGELLWQLCRRVWARRLDVAVLSGAIALPDYEAKRRAYIACAWLPPKWDWVDPVRAHKAQRRTATTRPCTPPLHLRRRQSLQRPNGVFGQRHATFINDFRMIAAHARQRMPQGPQRPARRGGRNAQKRRGGLAPTHVRHRIAQIVGILRQGPPRGDLPLPHFNQHNRRVGRRF